MELKPGYQQSDIGIIPSDWDVKTLGDIGDCLIGLTYEPRIVRPRGLLVLRASNIADGVLQFDDNVFVDMEIPPKLLVRKNDILICVRNGSRELIGKCAFIKEQAEGMTFGAFMSVFRTPNAEFVFYQFQSDLVKRQIREHLGATINQITNKSLRSFRIPLPKEEAEQAAIAAALSDVDALIGALDKVIAKKRDLKQAAMQQLLTGKQRLPGFSREWEVKPLEELAQIVSGGTPKTTIETYWRGSIKWCTPTDITGCSGKYLHETERTISTEGLANCSAQLLPAGSLLLCSRATIGEIRIAGCEICTNQGFKSLVCKRGVNNEFLYYKLLTLKSKMVERAIGSTFLEISKKDTALLEISIPEQEEQTAIVTALSDMDSEIAALEQRRDKTRLLKQGMMQELLTGRIRLV